MVSFSEVVVVSMVVMVNPLPDVSFTSRTRRVSSTPIEALFCHSKSCWCLPLCPSCWCPSFWPVQTLKGALARRGGGGSSGADESLPSFEPEDVANGAVGLVEY